MYPQYIIQRTKSASFGKHRSKSTSTAALLQKSGININRERDWGGCPGISMDSESKENARPDVSIIEYNGFKIVCRMIMSIPFQKFGVETYNVEKGLTLGLHFCSESLCIKPTSPAAFQFEKPHLLLSDIRLIHHNQHHRRLGWLPMIYLSCKLRVMEIASFEQ